MRYVVRNPGPEYKRAWNERDRRRRGIPERQRADVICPFCASPKCRQSTLCQACFTDLQRARAESKGVYV